MNQIKIDGPKKLLNSIPKIIKYEPQNILIICGLQEIESTFSFHIAENIPDKNKLDGPYFEKIIARLNEHNCDSSVLVFYLNGEVDDKKEIAEIFFKNINPVLHVKDLIWVKNGNWASYLCQDNYCCPPEGSRIKDISAIAKKNTFDLKLLTLGKVDKKISNSSLKAHKKRWDLKDEKLIKKWQKTQFTHLISKNALDNELKNNWSRLLVALTDIPVRDALLSHFMEIGFSKKKPAAYFLSISKVWGKIGTIAPIEFHSPIFACLSAFLWQAEETDAAKKALQISLNQDPKFRLAILLSDAIDSGVSPSQFKDVFRNPTHPWS